MGHTFTYASILPLYLYSYNYILCKGLYSNNYYSPIYICTLLLPYPILIFPSLPIDDNDTHILHYYLSNIYTLPSYSYLNMHNLPLLILHSSPLYCIVLSSSEFIIITMPLC